MSSKKEQHSNSIRFGTGGIPLTTKNRNTTEGILRLAELGLRHMELEFVYSVYVKDKEVDSIIQATEENDVSLSVHGSYYTNFASEEDKKWYASQSRAKKAAIMGDKLGAKSLTFHTAFFQGKSIEEVFPRITEGLKKLLDEVEGLDIVIAPELTGKKTQYGSLAELIKTVKYFQKEFGVGKDRFKFCVDFAHKHARNNGSFKTKGEYRNFLDTIAGELGEEYLKDLHMHMSAINYSEKGERNHLTFLESYDAYEERGFDLPEIKPVYEELAKKDKLGGGEQDWQGLLEVLKEYQVTGWLVCESPNLEHDALLMQSYYQQI
jgi:deoxyribonuclease-4